MKRRVLVVAAEQFELGPIRRAVSGRDDTEFVLVANGPGPRLAREAVRSAGVPVAFDSFVSAGLCGALIDELSVATIVIGNQVNGIGIPEPRSGQAYYSGAIASVDYIAGTVEEKRRLRKTGAIAVEMEAAGVLDLAREAGRPFYCVKSVSDVADEGFTVNLNAARDGEGRFSVMRILGQACRSPLTAFPELARLKRNGERAASALGEFFAHCNF
jgi:adenosylhomocysteine nucleosidase